MVSLDHILAGRGQMLCTANISPEVLVTLHKHIPTMATESDFILLLHKKLYIYYGYLMLSPISKHGHNDAKSISEVLNMCTACIPQQGIQYKLNSVDTAMISSQDLIKK